MAMAMAMAMGGPRTGLVHFQGSHFLRISFPKHFESFRAFPALEK